MRVGARSVMTLGMAAAILLGSTNVALAQEDTTEQLVEEALIAVEQSTASEYNPAVAVASGSATVDVGGGTVGIAATDAVNSVVKSKSDGAQVLTVLRDGDEAASFNLTLPADTAMQKNGKGYDLVARSEGVSLTFATLDAPWAVDARGKKVKTSYELQGNRLVQTVESKNATYPVVADPRLTYGLGVYLNATGYELRSVATAIVAAGGVGAIAVCSGKWVPHPIIRNWSGVICTAVGSATLSTIYNRVLAIWRNGLVNTACYQVRIVPAVGSSFTRVGAQNCS